MANLSTADLVRRNFAWRIESLSPTSNIGHQHFSEVDPTLVSSDEGAFQRRFSVFWVGSGGENEASGEPIIDSLDGRIADHDFELEIYYSTKHRYKDLQDMILQDRHDITRALRDSDNSVGYDADNTSTNIGLLLRVRESDEIDRDDDVWTYRAKWRCTIEEGER